MKESSDALNSLRLSRRIDVRFAMGAAVILVMFGQLCVAALAVRADDGTDLRAQLHALEMENAKLRTAFQCMRNVMREQESIVLAGGCTVTADSKGEGQRAVERAGQGPTAEFPHDRDLRMRSDEYRTFRIESIDAMGGGAAHLSEFLLKCARREGEEEPIKSIAIRALSNVGDRRCADFMLEVLGNNRLASCRASAAKYFERLGNSADVSLLNLAEERESAPLVRKMLHDAIEAIVAREDVK